MKKILVLFTVFFIFSTVNVYAQNMSKYGYPISSEKQSQTYSLINSVNLFYGTDYMHYAETYERQNMDNESASLPGYGIKFSGIISPYIPVYLSANFSTYAGNSDYTGALQTKPPTPVESTDGSQYINYGINVGYTFSLLNRRTAIIPNVGYEWVKWNRNLKAIFLDTGDGYVEHYEFNHYSLGIRGYAFVTNKIWVESNIDYLINHNNQMTTATGTFNLGNKNGYDLGAEVGYAAYRKNSIEVSPYAEVDYIQNQEGQSQIVNGYLEPYDQSNQLIFNLGIKVGF